MSEIKPTSKIVNPLSKQTDRPARQKNPYTNQQSHKRKKENSDKRPGQKSLPDGLKFRFDEETSMFQILLKWAGLKYFI